MIYEAVCGTCGEVFNPFGYQLEDYLRKSTPIEHFFRSDGYVCGGHALPESLGKWLYRR